MKPIDTSDDLLAAIEETRAKTKTSTRSISKAGGKSPVSYSTWTRHQSVPRLDNAIAYAKAAGIRLFALPPED